MTVAVRRMAYTGTLPCGCIVNAVVIDEQTRMDQFEIGSWVRDGMTVDRRPVDELRDDPAFLRECGARYHA